MANLTPEQEATNRHHLVHQAKHISFDSNCGECRRKKMKEKLDQDKAFEDYMRKQAENGERMAG